MFIYLLYFLNNFGNIHQNCDIEIQFLKIGTLEDHIASRKCFKVNFRVVFKLNKKNLSHTFVRIDVPLNI